MLMAARLHVGGEGPHFPGLNKSVWNVAPWHSIGAELALGGAPVVGS